jgi:hypothetical protein
MVGDHTNSAPTATEKPSYAINEGVDLQVDLKNKERVKRMPQRIELTGFRPAAAFATYRHSRLIRIEHFDVRSRHRIAQTRGIRDLSA